MPRSWRPTKLFTLLDAAVDGARVETFGAHAVALMDAQRRGLPVADAWLLPATAFRDATNLELPPGHDPASLLRAVHKSNGLERAARARERLLSLELPKELASELDAFCRREADGAWLSLRTSPTLADDTLATASGLDAVVWGLRNAAELERAILRLWSLAVEERTLSYLRAQRQRDVAMALVIQRVSPVKASAVLVVHGGVPKFDVSPAAASPEDPHLIAAAWGLGAPAIEGASVLDYARLGIDGSVLARRIANKSVELVISDGGIGPSAVSSARRQTFALGDPALAEIAVLAKKLETVIPREIDLALGRDGALSVLEVRRRAGDGTPLGGGPTTVWSRTGLADLLPGVPTPLSASLVEDFADSSLRGALKALGAETPRGAELRSRVQGRYYLNVSALVPALSGIPGIEPSVVVDLLRGANPSEIKKALELERRRGSLPALSLAAARLFFSERKLEEALLRFEREADQHRRWLQDMDLAILPDDALVTTLRESRGFLETTGELLLRSSIAALAGHLALQAVLSRIEHAGAARMAQAVVAGVAQLESARPAIALAHVVEILRSDAPAREAVEQGTDSASALPEGPTRRALSTWLDAFGDRGLMELEAIAPRWREQQAPVFRMMRAGLAAPASDPEHRLSAVRVGADRELAALEAQASGVEIVLLRALLGRARALSRLRERMRVWMARTISMTRTVALDVDRRLRRLDAGLAKDSAFFLTYDELVSATARTRADLGPLVRMRRNGHQRDLERADPPDTFVGVPPRVVMPRFDGRELSGSPAAPGSVTGRARHIGPLAEGAERLEPGDVIVVRTPDVGLAPLFFWAGAVVSDSGSQLSHLAVVARELGVPAVCGAIDATTLIGDGELVRVDGDRGSVERVPT
jgi:rifampicin phosphotransferase